MVKVLTSNSEYRLVNSPHCGYGAAGEVFKVVGSHLEALGEAIMLVDGLEVGCHMAVFFPLDKTTMTTSVVREITN